jgi:hypothetical protein
MENTDEAQIDYIALRMNEYRKNEWMNNLM